MLGKFYVSFSRDPFYFKECGVSCPKDGQVFTEQSKQNFLILFARSKDFSNITQGRFLEVSRFSLALYMRTCQLHSPP